MILLPFWKLSSGIEPSFSTAMHSTMAISSGFINGERVLRLIHSPISNEKMHSTMPNIGEANNSCILSGLLFSDDSANC